MWNFGRRGPSTAAATLLAAVVAAVVAAVAPSVAADEPVRGNILVPIERVAPGGTFPVTGYQLDPGIVLRLTLRQGTTEVEVGTTTVREDGTVETTGTVPATFSDGYAELVVTSDVSGQWMASVLVGDPPSDPGKPAPPLIDERLIALGVMGLGLVIFVVALAAYLRGRPVASPPRE